MVKIINITKDIEPWLQKKTNAWIGASNALDPTDGRYAVPEFVEETINEMEKNGWRFVGLIHGAGLMFRSTTDLRDVAITLQEQGKI